MKYLFLLMIISVSNVQAREVQTECNAMNEGRQKITKSSGTKMVTRAAATKQ